MTLARRLLTAGGDLPAIGGALAGGYFAGIIDTGQSDAVLSEDAYQDVLRYALIVSPKSLEVNRQWKHSDVGSQFDARTRWNGLAATAAYWDEMTLQQDPSYPAMRYAANCDDEGFPWTGDGFEVDEPGDLSRWYLPALDELWLIYWTLKPDDTANTTGDIDGFALGDFPSESFPRGEVLSADPQRPPFTGDTPGQTGVGAFQRGGSEYVNFGGRPWTATESESDEAWRFTGWSGNITAASFDESRLVRPVRRLIL